MADNILIHNLRTRILADMGLVVKYNKISFHFRLFARNTNEKRNTIWGVILGPFCPNLGKNKISWKKGLCQFLIVPIIYLRAKIEKK